MKRALAAALASIVLGACAFAPVKAGPTRAGAAVVVAASTSESARRSAARSALDLFLAPGSSASLKAAELFAARAADVTGRVRFKDGKGIVELSFANFLLVLDREGLLRPAGFASSPPRVLLLVAEPSAVLDLGVGPAADAFRRGLSAYGMTAIDGRDALNDFQAKGREPAVLAAGAARLGANWMVVAAASARVEFDPEIRAWRGRASLVSDQYEVMGAVPIGQTRSEASVVDVSSAAAFGKALDRAGEEAAAKTAAAMTASLGGRSEGSVLVSGAFDLVRVKSLLAALRGVEGVSGAFLGAWRGEEDGVVLRVFLSGIQTDGLAARLLRRDPSITLLSVEPELGRLSIELPAGAPGPDVAGTETGWGGQ